MTDDMNYKKEWYEKNKDKVKLYNKQYYDEKLEKLKKLERLENEKLDGGVKSSHHIRKHKSRKHKSRKHHSKKHHSKKHHSKKHYTRKHHSRKHHSKKHSRKMSGGHYTKCPCGKSYIKKHSRSSK